MAERIIIHIEVDGDSVTLDPIDMGKAHQDGTYKDDIGWYSGGRTKCKKDNFPLYDYSFRMTRHKFDDEKDKEFGS